MIIRHSRNTKIHNLVLLYIYTFVHLYIYKGVGNTTGPQPPFLPLPIMLLLPLKSTGSTSIP